MPFQLSPGIEITELDLTTVIPAVATSSAAIGGVFKWGPVDKATLISSEDQLVKEYGKPDSDNHETWMTAANFLSYSNSLYVSRAHHSTGTDLKLEGYSPTGADYVIVTENTSTGVVANFEVVSSSKIAEGTTVDSVDTSTLGFAFTDSLVDVGNNIIETEPVGLVEGERVTVALDGAGTLPGGLAASTSYYLINVTPTSFQLSSSQGGSALDITSAGSGTFDVTRSGDTRITLSQAIVGTGGEFTHEFYDADWSFNAIANTAALATTSTLSDHVVKNDDTFELASANFDTSVKYVAKYPGALGNSLAVYVCDTAAQFSSTVTIAGNTAQTTTLSMTVGSNTATITTTGLVALTTAVSSQFAVSDLLRFGNTEIGYQYLEVTNISAPSGTTVTISFASALALSEPVSISNVGAVAGTFARYWKYSNNVEKAPSQSIYVSQQGNTAAQDELHVVVVDEDGAISGVPKSILEVFQGLSRASDAKGLDGNSIYYREVINQSSRYVWVASDRTNAPSATAANVASSTETTTLKLSFVLGKDIDGTEGTCNIGDILRAYDKFKSAEDYDVSLILAGKTRGGTNGTQIANYIVDNLCETRKDCVAFISPEKADVVDNFSSISEDVITFRNSLRSTSYAVLDSGYKYQYDKYNDVYRWVPLNGDVAGLCARTDDALDPWYSPAGFNRGQVKNIIKLAWNPNKAERDTLYGNGVNPVVNFQGQGVVLYGDKTLLARPSAFDRINVRRLFIVLEKAITVASQATLFEFNDEFTRASFVNLVTPFLRDVKSRKGITDFIVVCDQTNNTGEVIDRGEFVGDIYIKPARSINFIRLNFAAVRSGVQFSEIIGNL